MKAWEIRIISHGRIRALVSFNVFFLLGGEFFSQLFSDILSST